MCYFVYLKLDNLTVTLFDLFHILYVPLFPVIITDPTAQEASGFGVSEGLQNIRSHSMEWMF